MDDFASASMLRLLLRAMAADGLAAPLPLPDGAHVPLQHKHQVVSCIVRAGGLPLLLRLAQQVQHIEGEPLHQALIGARDPHEFLARWQRLERYVHSRHRVLARERHESSLRLEHTAQGSTPPMAAEGVAVLGVWIGALRAMGTRGLRVQVADCVVFSEDGASVWPAASLQCWQLQWTPCTQTPAVAADRRSATPPLSGTLPWPEPAAELARWLARDPAARPRAADAAAALDLPLRTLQRRLAMAGVSFSDLVAEMRVRLAAAWLAAGTSTLAEIGFACGYADQAHFTREFKRRAGMPPARYRSATDLQ
jgi:AraC-like DNA-binding protein